MTYQHTRTDNNLRNIATALDYNTDGQPVLRVASSTLQTGNSNNANANNTTFGQLRVSGQNVLNEARTHYGLNNIQEYFLITGGNGYNTPFIIRKCTWHEYDNIIW